MNVLSKATIRLFGDTEPGDFVAFGRDSRNFGIVLEKQGGQRLVGMVTPDDEPHPQIVSAGPRNQCMSFGGDWVIEPAIGPLSFPNLHESRARHISGLLALTEDGWLMSFAGTAASRGRFALQWWHLEHFKNMDVESAALFNSWKIWETAESRNNGADPLYTYKAEPLPRD